MTTISVVIPTYNREHYILDSVKSVLSQRVPKNYKLEVIVVDDGSTDSTSDALKGVKDKITYIKTTNSGRPAVARNIGIQNASGELIAFQDSDDIWTASKLMSQLPAFKDPSVVLSYGNAEFISASGTRKHRTIINEGDAVSGDVFDYLVKQNFVSTLTVIVRKQALLDAGGFNENWKLRGVEDYELWLRLAMVGNFDFTNKTLALYRQHDANISSNSELESYQRLSNVFRSTLIACRDYRQRRLAYDSLLQALRTVLGIQRTIPNKLRVIYFQLRRKLV